MELEQELELERMMKGSRLPEDWKLPEDWAQWAEEHSPGLDIKGIADEFKDYWISKSGQNATKLNWQATWRNWIRNTLKYNGRKPQKPSAHKVVHRKAVTQSEWKSAKEIGQQKLSEMRRKLKV